MKKLRQACKRVVAKIAKTRDLQGFLRCLTDLPDFSPITLDGANNFIVCILCCVEMVVAKSLQHPRVIESTPKSLNTKEKKMVAMRIAVEHFMAIASTELDTIPSHLLGSVRGFLVEGLADFVMECTCSPPSSIPVDYDMQQVRLEILWMLSNYLSSPNSRLSNELCSPYQLPLGANTASMLVVALVTRKFNERMDDFHARKAAYDFIVTFSALCKILPGSSATHFLSNLLQHKRQKKYVNHLHTGLSTHWHILLKFTDETSLAALASLLEKIQVPNSMSLGREMHALMKATRSVVPVPPRTSRTKQSTPPQAQNTAAQKKAAKKTKTAINTPPTSNSNPHINHTKLSMDFMKYIACSTNTSADNAVICDLIGQGTSALADQLPILPMSYATINAALRVISTGLDHRYTQFLMLHQAVNLRCQVASTFQQILYKCSKHFDRVAEVHSIRELCQLQYPLLNEHTITTTAQNNNNGGVILSVTRNFLRSHPCTYPAKVPLVHLLPNQLLLVLLPLRTLLPRWVDYMRTTGCKEEHVKDFLQSIPTQWKVLGCYPKVCCVTKPLSFDEDECSVLLFTAKECRAPKTAKGGNAPSIALQDVLRICFTPSDPIYVEWLGSLNPMVTDLVQELNLTLTKFKSILNDPKETAADSRKFLKAIVNHMKPPLVNQVRARMVLEQSLNQEQATAVAMVLYSCLPLWDKSTPIHEDVADSGALIYDRGAETTFRGVKVPDILVIEGPPGTGKTHTLSVAVLNLLHHLPRGSRVLVCAPSNCAVDECLTRLCKDPHRIHVSHTVRRVGVNENIGPRVIALTPPVFVDDVVITSLQMSDEWVSASNKLKNKLFEKKRKEDLSCANVIFTTLGSLRQLRKLKMKFDVVVVDEASQATEPEVVRALSRLNEGGKCILIGDSKQLQPTVLSNEAAHKGLNRSLLVRLLHCGHRSLQLRQQYRMHPDICAFPSNYFYDNTLHTAESVLLRSGLGDMTYGTQRMSDISKVLGNTPRLVFMDVPHTKKQKSKGRSLHNLQEAAVVVRLMRQLAGLLKLSPTDVAAKVGIITFYRGQKDAIESQLTQVEMDHGVEVATVDSFQGREKDIIIISCVRAASDTPQDLLKGSSTDARTALGFLCDHRRINVALTRAKELCVVVGDATTLSITQPEGESNVAEAQVTEVPTDNDHHVLKHLIEYCSTTSESAAAHASCVRLSSGEQGNLLSWMHSL